MHKHSRKEDRSWRGWLYMGRFQLGAEVSWRWRGGFIATWAYDGQEAFCKWCLAVPGLFLHLSLTTPYSWKWLRPFDGEYGEACREFGLRTIGHDLQLCLGHDPMGTYYGTRGRFRWLHHLWKNQIITLFREDWILGRARFTKETLETDIPVTVDVGQWDGDVYHGTATREHFTWKRRFSTQERTDYWIEMDHPGIPFPGKGENSWDCGDDATYGFGGASIESAIARILEDTKKTRLRHGGTNWRPTEARSA